MVYPSDAGIQLPLAHSLQQKHEVGPALFNNSFHQARHLQAASQWFSDSLNVVQAPTSGYSSGCVSGGSPGLQYVNSCQSHILGPIQQPEVQPTPPCFWTDRLNSQNLQPLPRPICSPLETAFKPEVHHHAGCSYSVSQLKRVYSGFSANPLTAYNKSLGLGQHICHDSQLYNTSYMNNALVTSISPQHSETVGSGYIPSASLNPPATTSDNDTRVYVEAASYAKNVMQIEKPNIQLDENCNHIYNSSVNMLPIESGEDKHTVQKYEDEETSLEEENLSTSVIEEYIQSAPDFQCLSQINLDHSEVKSPGLDLTASKSISVGFSKKSSPAVSPQFADAVSTEVIQNNNIQGNEKKNAPTLTSSFTKTKKRSKRGFTQLRNFAGRLKRNPNVGCIRSRGNEDGKAPAVCSSSSSEISPINADRESSGATQGVSRRRSYRSRNFSKEFCNRWSSFEDVPLVVSRQPDYSVVCSTPKNPNTGDEVPDKEFSCETCGKRFFSHYAYSRHVKKHKVDSENCQHKAARSRGVYRCSLCNVTWVSHDQYLFHSCCHKSRGLLSFTEEKQECQHQVDHCRPKLVSNGQGQMFYKIGQSQNYICSICRNSFSSCYEYNLHCSKHGRTEEMTSSNESDSSASSPRYFNCIVCDVKFVNRFMYSKHCVSEEHRINQKKRATEIPNSNISDRVGGKPMEHEQVVDLKLSSKGKGDTACSSQQYRYDLEDPDPVTHPGKRNKVQLLPNKTFARYMNTTEMGAHLFVPHGIPTSVICNVDSGKNTNLINYQYKQHSINRPSKSAVYCKFLFLKAKHRVNKSSLKSRHIKTVCADGVEQNNMVLNQAKGSSVDASGPSATNACSCQLSRENGGTDKGLKGSLDENNNPTEIPKCPEHIQRHLSNWYAPTAHDVSRLCDNTIDGLNDVKSSITGSSEDASDTEEHLAISSHCSVNESLLTKHYPLVSSNQLKNQVDLNMPLVADMLNLNIIPQLKPAGNGRQVTSTNIQTDDSGLEMSVEVFNGKCPEGWRGRLDTDKIKFVDSEGTRQTVSNGLDVESGKIANSISIGPEEAIALKGDSGLWSDEEVGSSESNVEENVVMANNRSDGLNESSSRNAMKDDGSVDLYQENAQKSDVWCIEIVDISARSSRLDVSCPLSTQASLTEEKNIIALEVRYAAKTSSLDLGESVEVVTTSSLKHLSECGHRSSDSEGKLGLLADQNITADPINNKLSVEDKNSSSNTGTNQRGHVTQPLTIHRSRRAKLSRLSDGDFHNGKIYFCEICDETFVNPFRYSAHYKKRAHVELASQFGYENVSGVGANVTRRTRGKGQKLELQQDGSSFKRMKILKARKAEKIFGKKRRKRHSKSEMHRGSAESENVKCCSTSKLVKRGKQHPSSAAQLSQADCGKTERRWSDQILRSNRLKKMASSNKLKNLKSKLKHSSCKYNFRIARNIEKMVVSETKKTDFICTSCSMLFLTRRELHLHVCSEKRGNNSFNNKSSTNAGSTNENRDRMTADKKEKSSFDDGQLDEQPLKKRKPVVKCPALFKMLTGARQMQNGQSCSSDTYKHALKKPRRKHLCSRKRKLSTNNKKKPDKTRSTALAKKPDKTESTTLSNLDNQTESILRAKKMKMDSKLLCHDKDIKKKTKSRDGTAEIDTSEVEKSVKTGKLLEWDVYCEVCEKFYSSRSHLYRHYKTNIHKQQMQAKKNNQV